MSDVKVWIKPRGCRVWHLFTDNCSMCLKFWRSAIPNGRILRESVNSEEACTKCWRRQ